MKRILIIFTAVIATGTAAYAQTTGKVGVNTTTPEATLDVRGSTSDKTAIFRNGMGGESVTITNVGTIGIAEPNPKAYLDIKALPGVGPGIKMQDGTQGAGKVLTSDAVGNASWQNPQLPPPPADPLTAPKFVWSADAAANTKDNNGYKRYGPFTVPTTGWHVMQSRWYYVQSGTTDLGAAYFWLQINANGTNTMDAVPYHMYEYRAVVNQQIGISPPSGALVYLKKDTSYYIHTTTYSTSYPGSGERKFIFYPMQ